jgi:accessory gene regulator B
MVEYLSHFIAATLKNEDTHNKMRSYEVLVYGLKIIINTLSVICLTMLLGWAFGWFVDVVIAMLSFALLRSFSGGYHIKSSDLCVLVSSGSMLLITATYELVNVPIYIYYIVNIISLIVMVMFAPSNKTKIEKTPKKFFVYKVISSLMVITLFILHNDLIAITFFIQAITIIIEKKVRS